eukprot:TRINITY_DN2488_c0_g1_i1.p1 TRINITY_DN2488_c0_g1~~TRINITY_DN2488_c0_g1_i1.p1  ORF type:complete len:248 (-),score=22.85 TRINITY_DN2488_c0_g1_i1:628-1371(-)
MKPYYHGYISPKMAFSGVRAFPPSPKTRSVVRTAVHLASRDLSAMMRNNPRAYPSGSYRNASSFTSILRASRPMLGGGHSTGPQGPESRPVFERYNKPCGSGPNGAISVGDVYRYRGTLPNGRTMSDLDQQSIGLMFMIITFLIYQAYYKITLKPRSPPFKFAAATTALLILTLVFPAIGLFSHSMINIICALTISTCVIFYVMLGMGPLRDDVVARVGRPGNIYYPPPKPKEEAVHGHGHGHGHGH